MIICKYSSLSHKPDYQGSGLNTYQFVSLFRFDTAKKIKSLGNRNNIADQITGQNDDYWLGIPRANLELKHVSIICSYHNKHLMWSLFISIGGNDKLLNERDLEIGFSEHYDLPFTPYRQILVLS